MRDGTAALIAIATTIFMCVVFAFAIEELADEDVPCYTDNVLEEVHYAVDGYGRTVCYVTRYDPVTGVNWVMKFEVLPQTEANSR